MTCTLLDKTIELLKATDKSVDIISAETRLSRHWLNSMLYKDGIDPSVTKIVTLYEYLSGKQLEV